MSKNNYDVCTYWGDRRETLDACSERLTKFLKLLSECDSIFERWFKLGKSRKDALRHQVLIDKDTLRSILDKGRHYTDIPRKLMEDLGFSIGLWNGKSDEEGPAGFHTNCGAWCYRTAKLVNNCIIDLPTKGAAVERIYNSDMLEKILLSVVRAWEPDWGLVSSYKLRTMVEMPPHAPEFAWLLYLSNKRGKIPELLSPSRTVAVEGLGTIVITIDEVFDIENPHHVEMVKKVYRTLGDAGLLKPIA